MIAIKMGVRLHGIKAEIVMAVLVAEGIWANEDETLVITSVIDGTHMRASIHYTGGAIDFRVPGSKAVTLRNRLAGALGDDYDVVEEGDHIHVEWQPKEAYS